jgi:hypothetical protein
MDDCKDENNQSAQKEANEREERDSPFTAGIRTISSYGEGVPTEVHISGQDSH